MNTIDVLYKEFKIQLLEELKQSIMDELTPKLKELILEAAKEIKTEEEYQLVEWFTNKYPISKKTFHKYKNLGYVDSKQVGRFKIYSVMQWIDNLNKIKSGKPNFLKLLI